MRRTTWILAATATLVLGVVSGPVRAAETPTIAGDAWQTCQGHIIYQYDVTPVPGVDFGVAVTVDGTDEDFVLAEASSGAWLGPLFSTSVSHQVVFRLGTWDPEQNWVQLATDEVTVAAPISCDDFTATASMSCQGVITIDVTVDPDAYATDLIYVVIDWDPGPGTHIFEAADESSFEFRVPGYNPEVVHDVEVYWDNYIAESYYHLLDFVVQRTAVPSCDRESTCTHGEFSATYSGGSLAYVTYEAGTGDCFSTPFMVHRIRHGRDREIERYITDGDTQSVRVPPKGRVIIACRDHHWTFRRDA